MNEKARKGSGAGGIKRRACGVAALLLTVMASGAGIVFDGAQRTVRIVDYPEAYPCTPSLLYAAAQSHGWTCVTYQAGSDTYTVDATVCIGDNDGSETCFQLGQTSQPHETMVVKGDVIVSPYYVEGRNPGRWYTAKHALNRLQIGLTDRPDVRPALKIASAPENPRTLSVGAKGFGGQLHVYHGTITAATSDWAHAIAGAGPNQLVVMKGDSIILRDAHLSWMTGVMTYGAQAFKPVATLTVRFECENTVFENGGTALTDAGPGTVIRNCVFRKLQTAIGDYGNLNLVLIQCVFKDNQRNWELTHSAQGLLCIDCRMGAPSTGNVYKAWLNPKTGQWNYPGVIEQKHIRVCARDEQDRPVTNAVVNVLNEQGQAGQVQHGRQPVDAQGRTPGWENKAGPIILTQSARKAVDQSGKPSETFYSYKICVKADGFEDAVIAGYKPTAIGAEVRVPMRRKTRKD